MSKKKIQRYKLMSAVTTLKGNDCCYEAQVDLICAQCQAVIPANSYFARKILSSRGAAWPRPVCRVCKPFDMLQGRDSLKTVPRDEEYLYVSDWE